MLKRFITITAILILGTGWSQADAMTAVKAVNTPAIDQAVIEPLPANVFAGPRETLSRLLLVGDRFMGEGYFLAAFQVYLKAYTTANFHGLHEEAEPVSWQMGIALWQLAKKENNPHFANIARSIWTAAGSKSLPDPRCANEATTESAGNR